MCTLLSVICMQMLKISNQPNQDLVRNAEQFGHLLALTLNEVVPETIKSRSNVGMYICIITFVHLSNTYVPLTITSFQ